MFYAFCHNWSIVLCETKSKLFPARIPNYQAVFRKVWILYKFGFFHNASFVPPGAGLPPLTDFLFRLVAFLSLPPCPLLVGFPPAVCRKPFRFLWREVCPGLFNRHKLLYGFLLGRLLRLAGFSFLPPFLLPLPVVCKPLFLRFQFLRGEKPRFLSCIIGNSSCRRNLELK